MCDSTAEEGYREVCALQAGIRSEQPMAREVPPGQSTPQLPSGVAPKEQLRRLEDFDARTQGLIGDTAYAELPVTPARPGLLWIEYFTRLDVLHDALAKKRTEILGENL